MSKKIEFVYTPKHGSWLNMVEIELSVLVRQCLKRRLPDTQALEREAGAWCKERNRLVLQRHFALPGSSVSILGTLQRSLIIFATH